MARRGGFATLLVLGACARPAPALTVAAPAGRRLQITVERVAQDLEPREDASAAVAGEVHYDVAVLASGHAHVEAFRDAFGPIVSWAALKREGALPVQSPVARLWASVAAAAAGDPACSSATVGRQWVRWVVLPRR